MNFILEQTVDVLVLLKKSSCTENLLPWLPLSGNCCADEVDMMFLWSSGQAMVWPINASLLKQWHMLIHLIPGYNSQSDKRMCFA